MECTNAKAKAELSSQEAQTHLAAAQRAHKKSLAAAAKSLDSLPLESGDNKEFLEYTSSGTDGDKALPQKTLLFHCWSPSSLSETGSDI